MKSIKKIALIIGPLVAAIIHLFFNIPEYPMASTMLGIGFWMVLWWITECVPLAVTALIPLITFPLTGIASAKEIAPRYMTSIMFLFIGGFLIAQAMERTGLHKRIALLILSRWHATPMQMMAGFIGATAFLSMWVSNTATTMLMLTIALAVLSRIDGLQLSKAVTTSFATTLLLMIAYAANLGGMATPVGTVPNLVFLELITEQNAALRPTFLQWMLVGVPLALAGLGLLLIIARLRVHKLSWFSADELGVREDHEALGPMRYEEKAVAWVLGMAALAWMTRKGIALDSFTIPGWSSLLPYDGVDDGTVAVIAAFILFLIKAKDGSAILGQDAFSRLPWGVLILLGGGFALATGVQNSGLSSWIGESLYFFSGLSFVLVLLAVAVLMIFLTEMTSNTAITQVMLPILAALALGANYDMTMLMLTATFAASCAFMLPVATPPNAIVFASGRIPMQTMVRTGIVLNLLMPIVIVSVLWLLRGLLPSL
ncbi:MAG: hypothetical protein COC05_01635 [Gammaproteobacteria bacterium]|nr:MAG: hypothetical protein COC05_01635 [Gammaproteobacteria bacterium]